MYPLFFYDVYKDYIWGGRNLKRFGKKLPSGITGESWEISCHPDGPGIVCEGPCKGKKLEDLINEYPEEIMGKYIVKSFGKVFPLLVKFIDAENKLSVQVHPDDDYALVHENENGKNEMWYILAAKPGAKLIYDVKKDTSKSEFKRKLTEGNPEDCLNFVNVKEGDIIYIPAGLIHAIGEGIVLIEIQQNSNSTYRVYDYNRKGKDGKLRPLHIDKAMDVINFEHAGRRAVYSGLTIESSDCDRKILSASKYFCAEEWRLKTGVNIRTNNQKFYIVTCIEGKAEIKTGDFASIIEKGRSCLIPAACDNACIKGESKLIVSYIPSINNDIIEPLLNEGYDKSVILSEIPGLI